MISVIWSNGYGEASLSPEMVKDEREARRITLCRYHGFQGGKRWPGLGKDCSMALHRVDEIFGVEPEPYAIIQLDKKGKPRLTLA